MSLSDPPVDGQFVEHASKKYKTVQEGRAYILIPPDAPLETDPKANKNGTIQASSVFYNPIQQYNRDLSVLAIRAFSEDYLAKKRKELERKEAKRRNRNQKKEARQRDATEGEDTERSAKRRKVDSESHATHDPIPPSSALNGSVEQKDRADPVDIVVDEINTDELPDDDLIACESSMAQAETQNGSHHPSKVKTDTKETIRSPRFEILDALSASGLRALRYSQELPFVTSVTANDLSPKAVETIKLNIEHNKLHGKIRTTIGNANAHMYQSVAQEGVGGPDYAQRQYQVIDLDPYGTAVPFLDAAVQAIADEGLLCVTCTDTGVFNSIGWPEKAFSLYGGVPIKGDHFAEGGLRLILHAICSAAAKYGAAIEPLLSLSIDYYARVFVRVRKSPAEVKFLAGKTVLVYNCDAGCGAWKTQPLARHTTQQGKKGNVYFKHSLAQAPTASPNCSHCDFKTHLTGPMYGGPLHNPAFIERILDYLPELDKKVYPTIDRLEGMLVTALEETDLYGEKYVESGPDKENTGLARIDPTLIDHHPFYFKASSLAKVLHCQAPSDAQLKGALLHAGYRVARSHTKPGTIKTDAPWSAIWRIMTEWIRQHSPLHEGSLKETMAGWQVLRKTGYFQDTDKAATADGPESIATKKAEQPDSDKKGTGSPTGNGEGTGNFKVVFDEKLGRDKQSKRLVRYQTNPRANWGPMTRAKSSR